LIIKFSFFLTLNSYLPPNDRLQGAFPPGAKGGHGAPNFGKEREVMINSNTAHGSSDPLASEKIQVDRKVFFLDLKENQRGRFLKITEDVSGRRDTIMLPASALKDFVSALSRLVDLEERL
jgi:PurA ssDNA and RNA-binding protein